MWISSSVLVMSRPCRAFSSRRSFCACTLTGPWLAISLMPSLRTNRLRPWPTPTNRRLTTLRLAAPPALSIRFFSAASCRCWPLVRAMPCGALSSRTWDLSCSRSWRSRFSCAATSAASALAAWASTESFCSCSPACCRRPTAASMSSTGPCALACASALMKIPLPPRMAP
ncbi:hypothetical protein D3C81_1558560 [compost metagenome]